MYEDNMLDGINIVAKMPVTIKGDTIVYNADSFKQARAAIEAAKRMLRAGGKLCSYQLYSSKLNSFRLPGSFSFAGDGHIRIKNLN